MWDTFYDTGFVTATADDSCLDWSAKYQKQHTYKVDHQFASPFCLPEVHPLENPHGNMKGPFSILRRCLTGKYVHTYVFNYLQQFLYNYHDVPKFAFAAFNEGHEGTGDVIGLVDDDLVEFLEILDYNNTALFLVSDHGLHMHPLFAFGAQSTVQENAFALLITAFPNWFLEKYPDVKDNLEHNQQALLTPFEIYESLQRLTNFKVKQKPRESCSTSIFDNIPYSRNCEDAAIPSKFCKCNQY